MEATIIEEDDRGIGVRVSDNSGGTHTVALGFEGDVQGHSQDSYPDDPSERTPSEGANVNQAQQFAKYWVYKERGYDALGVREHPHRIAASMLVVAGLSPSAFEERFTDLYLQVASHYGDVERPRALPAGATSTNVTYQQDVYLGVEDELLGAIATGLADPDATAALEQLRSGEAATGASLGELLPAIATSEGAAAALSEVTAEDLLEAVSGIHVHWDDAAGEYHTDRGPEPGIDREPDARIDLLPYDPASIEEFQAQLVRVLCCQVRDAYLSMGIAPPPAFRIQGQGFYRNASWYEHYDVYERYHDPSAEISTWFEEHTPEDAYEVPGLTEAASAPGSS